MAEVVEADADAAEASLAEEGGEGAGEVGRVDRSAQRCGEHVPVVLPRGAGGVMLVLLLFVVAFQRLEAAVREGDATFGGPGLGGQRGEAVCVGALECAADGSGAPVEVEVFPAQAEEFALAEPGVQCEFEQRLQPVVMRRREELAGFRGGEGFEAAGPGCAGADVAGDVARDLLLAHGVLQGGLEHGVHVGQRQRRETLGTARSDGAATGLITPSIDAARAALAGGAELVEPGADVLGGELGELLLAEAGDEVPVGAGGVAGTADADGIFSIVKSGAISADSKGRAYVTQEMVSSGDALNVLFAGNPAYHKGGRGEQPNELIRRGSLKFDSSDVIYAGPNPFG